MNINDIPDSVLAKAIRDGCYAKNTRMDDGTFLLILAVPYGRDDSCNSLCEAFEAFNELVSAPDWDERQIQVLTANGDGLELFETSYEQLPEVKHDEYADQD